MGIKKTVTTTINLQFKNITFTDKGTPWRLHVPGERANDVISHPPSKNETLHIESVNVTITSSADIALMMDKFRQVIHEIAEVRRT